MENLSIIVPYRNRETHLNEFIPYMEKYLTEEEVDFGIFVIEQFDDKPFNRAKLLNVGFKESESFDYFAFHDVDMLPIDSDYSFPDGPTHLASEVEQFGWKLPYDGYFGGVTLFDKESFIKINGYSNEYWGWGAEDDDLLRRCSINGVETYRKDCKYRSLNHERPIDRNLYEKNIGKLNVFFNSPKSLEMSKKDGISDLEYEKIWESEITEKSKIIRVKI
jgi:hypothetical protein